MIAENIALLRESVPFDKVALVAVTKTQPPEIVREAYDAGLKIFGENRVQEAIEKAAALSDLELEWHLIGHLQTNKARQAVRLFTLIHSLDSPHLAAEINRCAKNLEKIQDVLMQINIAGEETKSGIEPEQVDEFAALICSLPNLRLRGVMTIAPFFEDPELARPIFRSARIIFENLKKCVPSPDSFQWLSMGMTHDYKVALEEGANMIRVGSGIFGARPAR